MNVAFLLRPKVNISFLYDDWTLRQGLEKMYRSHYRAIPVLRRDGTYLCTVTEGDFLWYLMDKSEDPDKPMSVRTMENVMLRDLLQLGKNPAVRIDAEFDELLSRIQEQNFVPVVDDRDVFCGIVTRRDIIASLLKEREKQK